MEQREARVKVWHKVVVATLPALAAACSSGASTGAADGATTDAIAHEASAGDAGQKDARSSADSASSDARTSDGAVEAAADARTDTTQPPADAPTSDGATDASGDTPADSPTADASDSGHAPGDGGADASDSGHSSSDGGHPVADSGADAACSPLAPCADAGVCTQGACCPAERACSATCCPTGEVCSGGSCVQPGTSCFDSNDCPSGSYCQYPVTADASAGIGDASPPDGGSCIALPVSRGVCVPGPATCPDGGSPHDGGSCIESCTYRLPSASVVPQLEYSWGGLAPDAGSPDDIIMAPIVLPIEDTNCDGKVDSNDIPDIIFTSFAHGSYDYSGKLHAMSVRGGQLVERWSLQSPILVDGTPLMIDPATQLAGADLDGVPGAEIVACLIPEVDGGAPMEIGYPAVVAVFNGDGTVAAATPVVACRMPAIADLNQDGFPEIIVEGGIIDGKTRLLTTFTSETGTEIPSIGQFAIGDIDGDGFLDVVGTGSAYHGDGKRFVNTGWTTCPCGDGSGLVALADIDHDGKPEVIATSPWSQTQHYVSIWHYMPGSTSETSFEWVQQHLDAVIPPNPMDGTGDWVGSPTVADFNGDGTPDIAVSSAVTYTVFDGTKLFTLDAGTAGTDGGTGKPFFLWNVYPVSDMEAQGGSTAFDLPGGGATAAYYADQQQLHVFDGVDGGVMFQQCNTGRTLWASPVIADVDGDGHADLLVVSNAYDDSNTQYQCQDYAGGPVAQSGLRIYGSALQPWVRTRAIWNEYGYHVTNVNDDGTVPSVESSDFSAGWNDSYRVNRQPAYDIPAPDAVVSLTMSCSGVFTLTATVSNVGQAVLPATVPVEFWGGSPAALIGGSFTSVPLYSGQSVTVTMTGTTAADGPFYAVVDPKGGGTSPSWEECRTDNNTSKAVSVTDVCGGADP